MSVVKHYLMKAIDNRFSKKIIGSILFLSDKIRKQSKLVNNILLFVAILI
jgi:hypothetical protein